MIPVWSRGSHPGNNAFVCCVVLLVDQIICLADLNCASNDKCPLYIHYQLCSSCLDVTNTGRFPSVPCRVAFKMVILVLRPVDHRDMERSHGRSNFGSGFQLKAVTISHWLCGY